MIKQNCNCRFYILNCFIFRWYQFVRQPHCNTVNRRCKTNQSFYGVTMVAVLLLVVLSLCTTGLAGLGQPTIGPRQNDPVVEHLIHFRQVVNNINTYIYIACWAWELLQGISLKFVVFAELVDSGSRSGFASGKRLYYTHYKTYPYLYCILRYVRRFHLQCCAVLAWSARNDLSSTKCYQQYYYWMAVTQSSGSWRKQEADHKFV